MLSIGAVKCLMRIAGLPESDLCALAEHMNAIREIMEKRKPDPEKAD